MVVSSVETPGRTSPCLTFDISSSYTFFACLFVFFNCRINTVAVGKDLLSSCL